MRHLRILCANPDCRADYVTSLQGDKTAPHRCAVCKCPMIQLSDGSASYKAGKRGHKRPTRPARREVQP